MSAYDASQIVRFKELFVIDWGDGTKLNPETDYYAVAEGDIIIRHTYKWPRVYAILVYLDVNGKQMYKKLSKLTRI